MLSAVTSWSISNKLFGLLGAALDMLQSSPFMMRGSVMLQRTLGPTDSLLYFHRGLPSRDKLAAHSDVTVLQLQSWCDYHRRNHCQTAETKLPCLFPWPLSSSSLGERSCWARFTLLWYHAQWSHTNHSHFSGSFPHCVTQSFSRHGIVSSG